MAELEEEAPESASQVEKDLLAYEEELPPEEDEVRRLAVKAAFERMSQRDWGRVLRRATATACKFCGDAGRAEELGAEAVTLIFEDRRKWNPARGSLVKFARVVARSLALNHEQSLPARSEAAPDSERDANVPQSSPQVEELAVARAVREESKERFSEICHEAKHDSDMMDVVRCAERGLRNADEQAAWLQRPREVVYEARRRLGRIIRRIYDEHPEAPALPKRKARGVHAKDGRATNEEPEGEDHES